MILSLFGGDKKAGVQLEHARVYLRPPKTADWRDWADLRTQSRDFLTPWEPTWPNDALTRQAFRRRLRQYDYEWEQGSGFSFFVFHKKSDLLLGGISFSNVRRGVSQTASLGYWVGEPHARQGYMSEALLASLEFAFDRLGLHRVEAACLTNNQASQKLLVKSGFSQQGYARQYLRIDGRWQDHLLFEILRNDPRGAAALQPDSMKSSA
ncbi:MAG: GNAT family protein [Pseudomonadota bacterium]